jgi:hypothetical protein
MTLLIIVIAFIIGLITGLVAQAINEDIANFVLAPIACLIRWIIPVGIWGRSLAQTSGFQMRKLDGQQVICESDGNTWLAVFERTDRHFSFSPLLLLPSHLVRLFVMRFGDELRLETKAGSGQGHIVIGLRLASGLLIARRRPEDLAYLAAHHKFPIHQLV